MSKTIAVGLDIAKNVFHAFGTNADGEPTVNRSLRRTEVIAFFERLPRALIGMEACGSAHHWARVLVALGHDVRLIHPSYVGPLVKRGKTDAIDAEAIAEAVTRKGMRFVPVKSAAQQATGMLFATRTLIVRQRIQASNALRTHLSELGIVATVGLSNVKGLIEIVRDEHSLPELAFNALEHLASQIESFGRQISALDKQILALARRDPDMHRLMTIPGVGPVTAAAIRTAVPDISGFRTSRHFAAWLGLTPKVYSSGGSTYLGRISKMGNRALRTLLVGGATSALRVAKDDTVTGRWLLRLRQRRPYKVVAVALANKTARVIWALLTKGGEYSPHGDALPG
jgi:transposase